MARPLEHVGENNNYAVLHDPNARAELGMPHDCPMCGREIAWEYLLCLWCRDQQLEDATVARDIWSRKSARVAKMSLEEVRARRSEGSRKAAHTKMAQKRERWRVEAEAALEAKGCA